MNSPRSRAPVEAHPRAAMHASPVHAPVLAAILVLCLAPHTAGASQASHRTEPPVSRLMDALRNGDLHSRRDAAVHAYEWAGRIEQSRQRSEEEARRTVLEPLRALLNSEADTWTLSILLEGLVQDRSGFLMPLYRDALRSPSADVRWRAYRYFSAHEAPDTRPIGRASWRERV
jgi:hypothetical protein